MRRDGKVKSEAMMGIAAALLVTALAAGAPAGPTGPETACKEAMVTTLAANTPDAFRNVVYIACIAALGDAQHRENAKQACDLQADALGDDYRFAVASTCMTAMMLMDKK